MGHSGPLVEDRHLNHDLVDRFRRLDPRSLKSPEGHRSGPSGQPHVTLRGLCFRRGLRVDGTPEFGGLYVTSIFNTSWGASANLLLKHVN